MVDLGTASSYAAISGASIGNTVSAVARRTRRFAATSASAAAQPTGFPPGVSPARKRRQRRRDAGARDLAAAYAEIAARTGGAPLAGALPAHGHARPVSIGGAASNTGTFKLDAGGDPNAVFVFQVNGALAFAALSHVKLIGGAQASRVFWQVNGAGAVGCRQLFAGTMIATDAVAIGNGSLFNGRAFALTGALTMDADEFYSAPPAVTITGGATAYTTTMSPTIGGTADVRHPRPYRDGQRADAPRYGVGRRVSVTPRSLANGRPRGDGDRHRRGRQHRHGVAAADRRHRAAGRQLEAAVTVATNDSTPTISGPPTCRPERS